MPSQNVVIGDSSLEYYLYLGVPVKTNCLAVLLQPESASSLSCSRATFAIWAHWCIDVTGSDVRDQLGESDTLWFGTTSCALAVRQEDG
jgi:hypothetical protein